jgi:hypothetical protein
MDGLRRSVLVLVAVGLLGFASTEALGQTTDDLTQVTSTVTEVVSGVTGTASSVTGGDSTSEDGDPSGGATAPITGAASSLPGDESGGTAEESRNKSTKSDGSSICTMSCGEASRDPGTFGTFLVTLKEGAPGGPSTHDRKGEAGAAVAGARAGEEQPEAVPPLPSPIAEALDGFPTWLGLLALAALGLSFAALVAIVAKSFLGERTMTNPPSDGRPVRRSV